MTRLYRGGGMPQIGASDLEKLQARLSGTVAVAGSEGYNEAIAIWNGAIDRHPAVVVRCAGSADVASALSFARERGLEVSVRGGGHGFSGFAVTDGGVMIDLTPMKSVRVDPGARMAVTGGGVHQSYGHRRADSRRWHGLAQRPGRPQLRPPGRRRDGHGGWPDPARIC